MDNKNNQEVCAVCGTILYKGACIYCNDDNNRLRTIQYRLLAVIDTIRSRPILKWREK